MVASVFHIQMLLLYVRNFDLLVSLHYIQTLLINKSLITHINFVVVSCFLWQDVNTHAVYTTICSRPTALPATNTAPVSIFPISFRPWINTVSAA
jgi:hypothetical protein